jgi:serine/threonine protein kinase
MTGEGELYLIMELIEGEPLDAYCDARRLRLMIGWSCSIKFSMPSIMPHRNLVVHRDLKPSNILIPHIAPAGHQLRQRPIVIDQVRDLRHLLSPYQRHDGSRGSQSAR